MSSKDTPWPGIQASTFFTLSEKNAVKLLCTKYGVKGPLNESILSAMRDGLDKMRDESAEMDEQTLDKIQEIMMSTSKFAEYISSHFNKSHDKVLGYYKDGLIKAKADLMLKIQKGSFDYPKDNIDKEIADLAKLSIFWLKDFKKILSDQITDKYSKCLLAESMNNTADIVLLLPKFSPAKLCEGKDPWAFLDKAKSAISNVEPFATINNIAGLRDNVGNSSLNKFAELSNKIGGPKCVKMTGLGSIAGKLAELKETQVTAEGIMKTDPMLRFLPTGKALIESYEMVAFMVTVLELISDLKNKK